MTFPLDVRWNYFINFDDITTTTLTFRVANEELQNLQTTTKTYPITFGTLNATSGIFPNIASAVNYYKDEATGWLLAEANAASSMVFVLRDVIPTFKTTNDLIKQYVAALPSFSPVSPTSAGLSFVGTGATGTQLSATKPSQLIATVSTLATGTLVLAAASTVVLKACATNDATEANWTTYGTQESNTGGVAIVEVVGQKGQLATPVLPAGWYVKLMNSGSGTHSESIISSFKTIY